MTALYPAPGNYRHYKGGTYTVLEVAKHTETLERLVVYRNIEHGTLWCRPLVEWHKPAPDGGKRFVPIEDIRTAP